MLLHASSKPSWQWSTLLWLSLTRNWMTLFRTMPCFNQRCANYCRILTRLCWEENHFLHFCYCSKWTPSGSWSQSKWSSTKTSINCYVTTSNTFNVACFVWLNKLLPFHPHWSQKHNKRINNKPKVYQQNQPVSNQFYKDQRKNFQL